MSFLSAEKMSTYILLDKLYILLLFIIINGEESTYTITSIYIHFYLSV